MTILISLVLFLAFLAYVGTYVWQALGEATVTAEAVGAEIRLSAMASGILIREETVLTTREPYVDVTAQEGAKLAAGAAVATAVRSEEGLERANHIHELEQEINRVSAALQELRSATDLTTRDATLTAAARQAAAAVARHDPVSLDAAALNLEAILLASSGEQVSAETLAGLQRELISLKAGAARDSTVLTADKPGVFSAYVDGYERLNSAILPELTPDSLQKLIDEGGEVPEGAYGKLVNDYHWYFAAVMTTVDASNLETGRSATLNFGRWYSADVSAQVVRLSPSENGRVVVVFRCDQALAETMGIRTAAAEVVFGTYSGIRIPAEAVRTDPETETAYVYTVTAMRLERKDITIIYAAEDYVIAARGADPGVLREGNTVVVSGKDLREGKIIE